jgi:integrase
LLLDYPLYFCSLSADIGRYVSVAEPELAPGVGPSEQEDKMAINLTEKTIQKLRKEPGRYRDALVKGLLLVVNGPNSAAWTLRFEIAGKEKWMGLGSLRDLSLSAARERARAKRLLLLDGIDPLEAKRAEKAARRADALRSMTFQQAAEAYVEQHGGKWSAKHTAQWSSSLAAYAYPVIGDLMVQAIDTALVLKVLEQPVQADARYPAGRLWQARRSSASLLRGRIESVLAWATIRGHRTGDNPARWSKHLSEVLPAGEVAQEHMAAMPWADVPEFVAALRTNISVAARCLEFTLLTAARSGEVLGARWDEINLDEAVWTIPASRMKSAREHRVPLAPAVIELLRSLYTQDGNEFVFIDGRRGGLAPKVMRRVLIQMGRDVTVHGFRSAFRDWAAERTSYPREVCEMALAHTIGDAVEAAYRRGDLFDKRRRLMQAWSDFCSTPVKATGEIVPLRAS